MRLVLNVIFTGILLWLTGCSATPSGQTELLVSAAISLQKPLEEIKEVYEAAHPNAAITYNFASSGSLQRQIEQGAPVDLFISAGAQQMDALEQQSLIEPGTRRNLAANELVLIVPPASAKVSGLADVSRVERLAVGEPQTVPAGQYAREWLASLGQWEPLSSQGKLVYAKDVRQVLLYVESGSVDAGLVYRTDVTDQVRVAAAAPEGSHRPIVYPLAVTAASRHKEEAARFARFLQEEAAQQILMAHGFRTTKEEAP